MIAIVLLRRFSHCLLLGLLVSTSAFAKTVIEAPAHQSEKILPLGTAEISDLSGTAFTGNPRRPLQKGERVAGDVRIETAPEPNSRVELRFADGSLLRLGQGAALTLLPTVRQVALHRGRLLVASDRMLGSIAVITRRLSFVPEGTTYVVELDDKIAGQAPRLSLSVLEGAVCACPIAVPVGGKPGPKGTAPITLPKMQKIPQNLIILPGERLDVPPDWADKSPPNPQPASLTEQLKSEPLIAGFARRLPTWLRIDDLADQQRRHFLAGRNQRLRREIFWKIPRPAALQLPKVLYEPDSVVVRYE